MVQVLHIRSAAILYRGATQHRDQIQCKQSPQRISWRSHLPEVHSTRLRAMRTLAPATVAAKAWAFREFPRNQQDMTLCWRTSPGERDNLAEQDTQDSATMIASDRAVYSRTVRFNAITEQASAATLSSNCRRLQSLFPVRFPHILVL